MKKIIIFLFVLILTSCAKKQDWKCSCEIYAASGNFIETKDIQNKIKTDADRECGELGNEKAGSGGAYECTVQ